MPLPVIGLASVGTLLTTLVTKVLTWYLKTRLGHLASILTTMTVVAAAFAAFTAAIYAALAGLTIIAPPSFGFAMSFIPPIAPVLYSVYMTALVSKRMFDWVAMIYMKTDRINRTSLLL